MYNRGRIETTIETTYSLSQAESNQASWMTSVSNHFLRYKSNNEMISATVSILLRCHTILDLQQSTPFNRRFNIQQ